MITFARGYIENDTVYKMAYNPSAVLASLTTLVTLKTLIILANVGATAKKLPPYISFSINLIRISKIEAMTTKKSN